MTESQSGEVELAVRASLDSGAQLRTPARDQPFRIERMDDEGIVLLLGKQEAWTRLPWSCIDGVVEFLAGRGWVRITGTGYSTQVDATTLDGYLKGWVRRATAGWVAAVLEHAGVVEIDRGRPMRVAADNEWRRPQ